MEERIIEIDTNDEEFMLYLFDSGMLGDIHTDKHKIELTTQMLLNFYPNLEDVIRMCAKYFLHSIKKNKELCDAEIMVKLGKEVSNEIKNRWL